MRSILLTSANIEEVKITKFNLSTPSGLSGFLKSLKRQFTLANMDIRKTKDSKLLHRAAEAMGLEDWPTLSASLTPPLKINNRTVSESKQRDAAATLKDLLESNQRIENGEDVDIDDSIYGRSVSRIEVFFSLGSDRDITFTVAVGARGEFDIESAKITVRGFDTIGVIHPEGEELLSLCELFESRVGFEVERFSQAINEIT